MRPLGARDHAKIFYLLLFVLGSFRTDEAGFLFFLDPIAFSLDVDRSRMVQQSIQNRRPQDRIAKNLAPCAIRFVRRQDDRSGLVTLGYDLEEEVGGRVLHPSIPNFVNDEQIRLGEHFDLLPDRVVLMSLLECLHQIVSGRKIDRVPLLDGFERDRHGQMGLTDAGRSQKDQVLPVRKKPKRGHLPDPPFVDGRLKTEVELIQRFVKRQAGHSRLHADKPFPFGQKFFLQQLVQKLQKVR